MCKNIKDILSNDQNNDGNITHLKTNNIQYYKLSTFFKTIKIIQNYDKDSAHHEQLLT